MKALAEWQSSPEGRAYDCLYVFENIVDDLTDVSKRREGVQCIRAYWDRFIAAKRKLDDIEIELTPFCRQRYGEAAE